MCEDPLNQNEAVFEFYSVITVQPFIEINILKELILFVSFVVDSAKSKCMLIS